MAGEEWLSIMTRKTGTCFNHAFKIIVAVSILNGDSDSCMNGTMTQRWEIQHEINVTSYITNILKVNDHTNLQ